MRQGCLAIDFCRQYLQGHGAFGGLKSGFPDKFIMFWTAKSRGKNPGAFDTG